MMATTKKDPAGDLWAEAVAEGEKAVTKNLPGQQVWMKWRDRILEEQKCAMFGSLDISTANIHKVREHIAYTAHDVAQEHISVMINGITLDSAKMPDHFITQLFRIPEMCGYKITFIKWLQIAYNIGQARATIRKPREGESGYPPAIVTFFEENRLGDMYSYLPQK